MLTYEELERYDGNSQHTFVFIESDLVLLGIALKNVDFSKIAETLRGFCVGGFEIDIDKKLESFKKDFQRLDCVLDERNKNQSRFIESHSSLSQE